MFDVAQSLQLQPAELLAGVEEFNGVAARAHDLPCLLSEQPPNGALLPATLAAERRHAFGVEQVGELLQ
jgi:hypothetical protein